MYNYGFIAKLLSAEWHIVTVVADVHAHIHISDV